MDIIKQQQDETTPNLWHIKIGGTATALVTDAEGLGFGCHYCFFCGFRPGFGRLSR